MIEIFGRATSSNVQLVMWAVAELGLEYERHDIGLEYGGNDTPEYLAMNPNGLVPVIRDSDVTMWESAAILRYLGARYGDAAFYPADPVERARLDMWAEWIKSTFANVLQQQLFWPLVRRDPDTVDFDAVRQAADRMGQLVGLLDARLGNGPYLGGENLTFADIMVGHLLYRYDTLEFAKPSAPNLWDYYQRLCQRPAYAKHVMVSYEPLRWSAPD